MQTDKNPISKQKHNHDHAGNHENGHGHTHSSQGKNDDICSHITNAFTAENDEKYRHYKLDEIISKYTKDFDEQFPALLLCSEIDKKFEKVKVPNKKISNKNSSNLGN